jgi:TPR repeat protein
VEPGIVKGQGFDNYYQTKRWIDLATREQNIDTLNFSEYSRMSGFTVAMRSLLTYADLGDADAMHYIGVMYEKGLGVEKDSSLATQWHQKAAAAREVAAMHHAITLWDLKKVEALLKVNPNLVYSKSADYSLGVSWGPSGQTPLLLATHRRAIAIVKLLLANKADVNVKDDDGDTPLIVALKNSDQELAKLLVANGADVNAKDKSGNTPMRLATSYRLLKTAELLRQHGGHD